MQDSAEKKKEKKKAKKELSIRERKFIKALMTGKSTAQAMRDAGYAENTALYKGGAKLKEVKHTIEQIMDRKGITDDRLLDVLIEGLQSKKVISSATKDIVDVEDYSTRHKYMETGFKLRGHLRDKLDLGGEVVSKVVFEVVK